MPRRKVDKAWTATVVVKSAMPEMLRREIEKHFLERKAGRPTLLQQLKKRNHDPFRVTLEMVKMHRSGGTYQAISEKYFVSKKAVFSFIQRLKHLGLYDKLAELVDREIVEEASLRIFYTVDGEFRSDVEYIQKFIERRELWQKPNVLKKYLRALAHIAKLTRKLPHQLSEEDIVKLLRDTYERRKQYLYGKREKAKGLARAHHLHRYALLSDHDIDQMARHYVYSTIVVPLRQIFKFIGRTELNERVLKAQEWKRERVIHDYLRREEVEKILGSNRFSFVEKLYVKMAITLGARSGRNNVWSSGLSGLRWSKINWKTKTIDVFESKTKGGTTWKQCSLCVFWDDLPDQLMEAFQYYREVNDDLIWKSLGVKNYLRFTRQLIRKMSELVGRYIKIHYLRKTHAVWLIEAGVPLEVIAGKPENAYFGVGWEDVNTLLKHYGAFTREKLMLEQSKVDYVFKGRTPSFVVARAEQIMRSLQGARDETERLAVLAREIVSLMLVR